MDENEADHYYVLKCVFTQISTKVYRSYYDFKTFALPNRPVTQRLPTITDRYLTVQHRYITVPGRPLPLLTVMPHRVDT